MHSLIRHFIISMIFVAAMSSCNKEEGVGGTASITGKIIAKEISNSGILLDEYPAAEERVYIVYGDHDIFDDDTIGNTILTILREKVSEGVEVRLIVDDVGSWHLKRRFFRKVNTASAI